MNIEQCFRLVTLIVAFALGFDSAHGHGDASHSVPSKSLKSKVAIVLHGGAGIILEKNFTPDLERQYRESLR